MAACACEGVRFKKTDLKTSEPVRNVKKKERLKEENSRENTAEHGGRTGGGLVGPVMQQTTTYTKITFIIPFTKTQLL